MASTVLSRTQTNGTSSKIFTTSIWFKRSPVTNVGNQPLWSSSSSTGDALDLILQGNGEISFEDTNGNAPKFVTSRKLNDPSAFYNVVVAVDSTQAIDTNRVKIYLNGVQETAFGTATLPTQNMDFAISTSADTMKFGSGGQGPSNFFNGLMSYVAFVDGTAYTPTSFGEVNAASGIWKINTAPSVTYGTNGCYLKMDTSSPGSDTSGNNNTFTAAGTPTLAQDNASNNLVTMNPLDNYFPSFTFSNGKTTVATGGNYSYPQATIYVNKGKWYWECKPISKASGQDEYMIGVQGKSATAVNQPAQSNNGITIYGRDGDTYGFGGGGTDYAASYTAGDIIGVALDCDNNKIYWSKNGAWSNGSGAWDSATFNAAVGDKAITDPNDVPQGGYSPVAGFYDSPVAVLSFNFGNGFFGTTAVASSNADAAGHGLFEYAVPTGFFTLNTKNLNTYG